MRVVLITQNDLFYLPEAIDYLVGLLDNNIKIVAAVCLDHSPFRKRNSFLKKSYDTLSIFGLRFFIHYGVWFFWKKFIRRDSVIRRLKKNDIEIIKLAGSISHPNSLQSINKHSPDILVSIAGNEIFRKPLIDLCEQGCLNLHTSALPKYRGLMPSFWVMCNGESETAVTVFQVDEGIDSGPIVNQRFISLANMSQSQLIRKSKLIGMELINDALLSIASGKLTTQPNDEKNSSYYGFPTRKDVLKFYSRGKKFF